MLVARAIGEGKRRLVAGSVFAPGETRAVQKILLHHPIKKAAVEETHATWKYSLSRALLDVAGIGDDRKHAGDRGPALDHHEISGPILARIRRGVPGR